jgi:hypothetical protein
MLAGKSSFSSCGSVRFLAGDQFRGEAALAARTPYHRQAGRHVKRGKLGLQFRRGAAREFIANKVAPRFGVNHQVIETRFDHEGIWLAE